jgi:hypothetical protein
MVDRVLSVEASLEALEALEAFEAIYLRLPILFTVECRGHQSPSESRRLPDPPPEAWWRDPSVRG